MTDEALLDWMGEHVISLSVEPATLSRFGQVTLWVSGIREPIGAATVREALQLAFRATI